MGDRDRTMVGPDESGNSLQTDGPPNWNARYGARHRWIRLTEFPAGILPPRKVRVYRRAGHFVVQWWDPGARKNLADRVDGDLLAALVRARQIDERLTELRSSGVVHRRLAHGELVGRYLGDLGRRADAGEVNPATVRRYAAALRHYQAYCERPDVARAYPNAASVNREFRLAFAGFLAGRDIAPNGRAGPALQPMRSPGFVLDTVRAMFEWAGDPDRGRLLPEGFRNPFRNLGSSRSTLKGDPLAEPDITLPMAIDFIAACDALQLRLFAPLLLFGLRAAEPCFLFREYFEADWVRVPNNADLDYRTKGRRDKRFPLISDLEPFWTLWRGGATYGLLYERRSVCIGGGRAGLRGATLAKLVCEFQRRCVAAGAPGAADRQRLRDHVLREAGGLGYDDVQSEFASITARLSWPRPATLKDLRHLFATTLNNAGMPEPYRRFLMGQAPGRAAIVAYTHLNELWRHYADAVRREWTPLVNAILCRTREVGQGG